MSTTTLALNDMAIALLEKGHYEAAADTLKDALKIGCYEHSTGLEDTQVIETASHRYVAALHQQQPQFSIDDPSMEVVDVRNYASLLGAAKYGARSSMAFPIRFSGSDTSRCDFSDEEEASKCLGITLYNHGLACLLCGRSERIKDTDCRFFSAACKSLQMAETTLTSLAEQHAADEEDDPSTELLFVAHVVSVMTLNCLSLVYSGQNANFKAEEAQELAFMLYSNMDQEGLAKTCLLQQRQETESTIQKDVA